MQSIHTGVLSILVNIKIGVLVKKKTLQEPLSIQVDLNQAIKEGLIFVDVIVTSECIHPYFLCIVTQCLFQEVSIM